MSVIFVEVLFFRFSLSSHRATLLLPLLCTHESSQDCINDVDDYKHAMELNTWSADILYKHMNLNRALTLYIYNVVLSDIFIIWNNFFILFLKLHLNDRQILQLIECIFWCGQLLEGVNVLSFTFLKGAFSRLGKLTELHKKMLQIRTFSW